MAPIIEHIETLKRKETVGEEDPFTLLEDELHDALSLYWEAATRILEGSGIQLIQPEIKAFALRKQFFSALFLYSYHQADISPPRRILYAAANQCLRGIVAGCDNLLDDEYQKTLETDLPTKATRFSRSWTSWCPSGCCLNCFLHDTGKGIFQAQNCWPRARPYLKPWRGVECRRHPKKGSLGNPHTGGCIDLRSPFQNRTPVSKPLGDSAHLRGDRTGERLSPSDRPLSNRAGVSSHGRHGGSGG